MPSRRFVEVFDMHASVTQPRGRRGAARPSRFGGGEVRQSARSVATVVHRCSPAVSVLVGLVCCFGGLLGMRSLWRRGVNVNVASPWRKVVTARGEFVKTGRFERKEHSTTRRLPRVPVCQVKPRSWLVVFMGHSGSSAIVSELAQNSGVYYELPEPVDHDTLETDSWGALAYTRSFFSRGVATGRIPGFKIRPTHLLNPDSRVREAWRTLIAEFDTAVVWQYRENQVKYAVGEYSHRYFNDTSAVEGLRGNETLAQRCQRGAGCRFRISNMTFLHELLLDAAISDEQIARATAGLFSGTRPPCVMALPYEDYLYSREAAMRGLLSFLQLPLESHAPTRRKATRDSLCAIVENFEDVCREFYGCWAWRMWLNDARNNCFCSNYIDGPGRSAKCVLVPERRDR